MIDIAHQQIRDIADRAGWSAHTLLCLIARWVDGAGQARVLLDYLDQIASEEDEAGALD